MEPYKTPEQQLEETCAKYCPNCKAIADLLEKHGSIEQIRLLCEAGEKLPINADGDRVTPFMDLYGVTSTGHLLHLRTLCGWEKHIYPDPSHSHNNLHESVLYSTPEAALKALNTEGE